jgi:hypothetical protein
MSLVEQELLTLTDHLSSPPVFRERTKVDEFEDTKELIRIRIWKKNRQHNGQKKINKRTNRQIASQYQRPGDRFLF